MDKFRPILVTGGTGLLGKGFAETAKKGNVVVCTHQRPYLVSGDTACRNADVRDEGMLHKLFEEFKFRTVVHAAGVANVDYVERNPQVSRELNMAGTHNVLSACQRFGAHLIHISTNAVFDGTKPPYCEADPTSPVNEYGRQKVECEELVQRNMPDATILRPILMYGWPYAEGRSNPAVWVIEKLRRKEPIKVVTDVVENPLFNFDCGRALWKVVEQQPRGILHIAGATTINRYDFAKQVASIFKLDASLITPVESSYFPTIATRPPNTSFSTELLEREFSHCPMTLMEGLREMKSCEERS